MIDKKTKWMANAPSALSGLVGDFAKAAKLRSPFVERWFNEYCLALIKNALQNEGTSRQATRNFQEWVGMHSLSHLPKGVQWFLFLLKDSEGLSNAHIKIIDKIESELLEGGSDLSIAAKKVMDCITIEGLGSYAEPIEDLSALRKSARFTKVQKLQKWVKGEDKAIRSNTISLN